jgi:predicted nucleic acid-binding protein
MKAFLDTSSLIKLYHYESDSDIIEGILSKEVDEIFLSELAVLEFRSAIWKKVKEGEIDEGLALKVISYFEDDFDNFQCIKLQSDIIKVASELLMKYGKKGLRTLDSIQFASALILRNQDCIFLISD